MTRRRRPLALSRPPSPRHQSSPCPTSQRPSWSNVMRRRTGSAPCSYRRATRWHSSAAPSLLVTGHWRPTSASSSGWSRRSDTGGRTSGGGASSSRRTTTASNTSSTSASPQSRNTIGSASYWASILLWSAGLAPRTSLRMRCPAATRRRASCWRSRHPASTSSRAFAKHRPWTLPCPALHRGGWLTAWSPTTGACTFPRRRPCCRRSWLPSMTTGTRAYTALFTACAGISTSPT
jgi:hypothetical protein